MYKKILPIALLLILSACSNVPAGYEGVIVNLYGSDRGVAEKTVGVGKYWLGMNEELYLFPTFLQNYTWTRNDREDESITMQTSDGLSINTDVGITYNIFKENVVKVFQKYRLGIKEITNTFLRNMTRDAMNTVASTMTVEQIYGNGKESFMSRVNQLVKANATNDGINVDKIYLIGSFRLPDSVINSINSKIEATQDAMKVENEVAKTRAEAQKMLVEAQANAQKTILLAESQAKANKLLAESLTSEYIKYQMIQKWDGQLSKITGGATPLINMPLEK